MELNAAVTIDGKSGQNENRTHTTYQFHCFHSGFFFIHKSIHIKTHTLQNIHIYAGCIVNHAKNVIGFFILSLGVLFAASANTTSIVPGYEKHNIFYSWLFPQKNHSIKSYDALNFQVQQK